MIKYNDHSRFLCLCVNCVAGQLSFSILDQVIKGMFEFSGCRRYHIVKEGDSCEACGSCGSKGWLQRHYEMFPSHDLGEYH